MYSRHSCPSFSHGTGKQFFKLDETTYVGTLDVTYPFKISGLSQAIKAGLLYNTRDRNFDARMFGLISGGNPFEVAIDEKVSLTSAFSSANYGSGNRQLVLEEISFRTDSYTAESNNIGLYLMLDSKVAEKLRLIGGARFEGYNVTLQSKGSNSPDVNNVKFNKILPSLNVVYSLTENRT
ncbi:MAG: TonB-dependent receptor [Saprospiraceae bacterium]|nr:TonB-dependent receptor [Saprospiraceae bacterium]